MWAHDLSWARFRRVGPEARTPQPENPLCADGEHSTPAARLEYTGVWSGRSNPGFHYSPLRAASRREVLCGPAFCIPAVGAMRPAAGIRFEAYFAS